MTHVGIPGELVGKKILMRKHPSLELPDLHKVKVLRLTTLGDGTVVVRYRYNWPFPITEHMEIGEFLKHVESPTSNRGGA